MKGPDAWELDEMLEISADDDIGPGDGGVGDMEGGDVGGGRDGLGEQVGVGQLGGFVGREERLHEGFEGLVGRSDVFGSGTDAIVSGSLERIVKTPSRTPRKNRSDPTRNSSSWTPPKTEVST